MTGLTFRKAAWIVFALALAVRLFFWAYIGAASEQKFLSADSQAYLRLAENLRSAGVFSRALQAPWQPEISMTPVYPVVLAGEAALLGAHPGWITLLQAFASALTAWLVVHLVRKAGGSVAQAGAAGVLFALEPVSIFLANLVLTETLFLLEVTAALHLMVDYAHTRQARKLALAACILGLAALTRPISQFLPLIWLPLLWLVPGSWQKKLQHSLLFLAVFLAWVGPWLLRNWTVSGAATLSDISYQNLVYYRAKAVLLDAAGLSEQQALAYLQVGLDSPLAQSLTYAQVMQVEQQRALQVFAQYPLATGEMTVKGAARLLLDPGYSAVCTLLDPASLTHECFPGQATMLGGSLVESTLAHFRSMSLFQQVVLVWSVLLTGGLYLGALLGAWRGLRQRQWFYLYLWVSTVVYYLALAAGAESNYRLRAPALPALAVLAGLALGSVFQSRKRGNL